MATTLQTAPAPYYRKCTPCAKLTAQAMRHPRVSVLTICASRHRLWSLAYQTHIDVDLHVQDIVKVLVYSDTTVEVMQATISQPPFAKPHQLTNHRAFLSSSVLYFSLPYSTLFISLVTYQSPISNIIQSPLKDLKIATLVFMNRLSSQNTMGFKKAIKKGLKKLPWSFIKSKLSIGRKSREVAPTAAAQDVVRVSVTTPARLVQLSLSMLNYTPSIPNRLRKTQRSNTSPPSISRLPTALTWANRRPTPLSPVLTNGILHDITSPQSASTQAANSTGGSQSLQAQSVTVLDQTELNKGPSLGEKYRKEQRIIVQSQSQPTIAVDDLSEQILEPFKDDEGFFAPALPSNLAISEDAWMQRPSRYSSYFEDTYVAESTSDAHSLQQSQQPIPTTTS